LPAAAAEPDVWSAPTATTVSPDAEAEVVSDMMEAILPSTGIGVGTGVGAMVGAMVGAAVVVGGACW